jgi:type II secretory pathway component GspD/PulD (secretin)
MHLKDALECAKQRQLLATDQEVVSSLRELNHIMLTPAARHRIEKMWHALLSSDASPKGSFLHIDEVSKKIFYRAKRSYVYDFEKFLNEIDLPIPQVIIEARLVITHKNFEESFGAQWSSLYNRRASIKHGIEFIGSGPLTDINNNPQPQQLASLMDWALNFFPDSALCGRTIKVPLVFGGNDLTTKRLNLVLNAAESRDELKTILKPRIITNHGEEAEILVGQNVPIETVVKETIEGSLRDIDTASYRDVGVKLRVKPFVLSDHASIFMDIYIENSKQVPEGKFPLINTTRSKNRVILKNGQTTMISGLIEDSSKDASTHMPFISKIPLLGWFFKGHRKSVSDSQMLIFITPTLL